MKAYEIVTADDLNAAIATFSSRAEAQAAADAAMPRRKHNRPYPVASGYHSAREGGARWIVYVGNVVLLRDGSMYDHQRGAMVRP